MRSRSFRASNPHGTHDLHFTEWGAQEAPAVLCLHGLTQNARSFDHLAAALSENQRVVCLDVVGRGQSDWLSDPMGYGFVQYVADAHALMAHLDVAEFDLVGTSMGGIIGMFMAAQDRTPVRRLVINDVGPFVPREAVARIRDYVGTDSDFPDLHDYEAYLRTIWAPFGELSDDQWRHLALTSARLKPGGRIGPNYDPAIRVPLMATPLEDADLWSVWDTISVPVLALRGVRSDLLTPDIARQMTARGPQAELAEFEGVGHAPALMADDQIEAVRGFLAT
jgi:pimeloyl-ACP methyl ester carboxylesterase